MLAGLRMFEEHEIREVATLNPASLINQAFSTLGAGRLTMPSLFLQINNETSKPRIYVKARDSPSK
jgi:hypothetical protein